MSGSAPRKHEVAANFSRAAWRYESLARHQAIAARNHYRPSRPELVPPAAIAHFKPIPLVTIDNAFGGWAKAQKLHFSDGGFFDRIYGP